MNNQDHTSRIREVYPRNRANADRDLYDPEAQEALLRAEQKKQRRRIRNILVGLLFAGLVILIGTFLFRRFATYNSYAVVWQKDLSEGSLVSYEPFGTGFLKVSRDGVTCVNGRGTVQWVDTYEMKSPQASVSGTYAIIADSKGNEVRIYGPEGKLGQAATILPLTRADIAGTGVAAVIEEDASASYIKYLNRDGSEMDITIKSILSGDGYPTDLALSPDGQRLMVSFAYLNGGDMRSRVVFYDFSEIGKNIPNRLVGGFDEPFSDSLVADVHYMDGTWSFAAGTSGLYFFSSRNLTSPELVKEVPETDEIRSLFYSGNYVGVVLDNTETEEHYRLEVYKADGTQVMKKYFDETFLTASLDGDCVFLFSSGQGAIYNLSGVRKFSGRLDFAVSAMRLGTLPGEFLMAGPTNLKGVRLR